MLSWLLASLDTDRDMGDKPSTPDQPSKPQTPKPVRNVKSYFVVTII